MASVEEEDAQRRQAQDEREDGKSVLPRALADEVHGSRHLKQAGVLVCGHLL